MVTQVIKLESNKFNSFEALQDEIRAFIGESSEMPSLKQLSHSQRFDLISGIIDSGGSRMVAGKMGLVFKSAEAHRQQQFSHTLYANSEDGQLSPRSNNSTQAAINRNN